jgi:hypothetical protein
MSEGQVYEHKDGRRFICTRYEPASINHEHYRHRGPKIPEKSAMRYGPVSKPTLYWMTNIKTLEEHRYDSLKDFEPVVVDVTLDQINQRVQERRKDQKIRQLQNQIKHEDDLIVRYEDDIQTCKYRRQCVEEELAQLTNE